MSACSFCNGPTVRRRIGRDADTYVCRECGVEFRVGPIDAEQLEQARRSRLVRDEREREGARDA